MCLWIVFRYSINTHHLLLILLLSGGKKVKLNICLSYDLQSSIFWNIPWGNFAHANENTHTIMSTAALSITTNCKDPNSSIVQDKYITVYSYDGILYHNMNESQEKMLTVKSKSHWKKKMSIVAFHFYKIKKQDKTILYFSVIGSQERRYLCGRRGWNTGKEWGSLRSWQYSISCPGW